MQLAKLKSPLIRCPVCTESGKREFPSRESAESALAAFNRRRAKQGGMRYRGVAYACGEHWHYGRPATGFCPACRVNLGKRGHRLSCPRSGGDAVGMRKRGES